MCISCPKKLSLRDEATWLRSGSRLWNVPADVGLLRARHMLSVTLHLPFTDSNYHLLNEFGKHDLCQFFFWSIVFKRYFKKCIICEYLLLLKRKTLQNLWPLIPKPSPSREETTVSFVCSLPDLSLCFYTHCTYPRCTVDSWTIWVWTVQVYSYVDFFFHYICGKESVNMYINLWMFNHGCEVLQGEWAHLTPMLIKGQLY